MNSHSLSSVVSSISLVICQLYPHCLAIFEPMCKVRTSVIALHTASASVVTRHCRFVMASTSGKPATRWIPDLLYTTHRIITCTPASPSVFANIRLSDPGMRQRRQQVLTRFGWWQDQGTAFQFAAFSYGISMGPFLYVAQTAL